jgi:hypothetical protein
MVRNVASAAVAVPMPNQSSMSVAVIQEHVGVDVRVPDAAVRSTSAAVFAYRT